MSFSRNYEPKNHGNSSTSSTTPPRRRRDETRGPRSFLVVYSQWHVPARKNEGTIPPRVFGGKKGREFDATWPARTEIWGSCSVIVIYRQWYLPAGQKNIVLLYVFNSNERCWFSVTWPIRTEIWDSCSFIMISSPWYNISCNLQSIVFARVTEKSTEFGATRSLIVTCSP